MDWDSLAFHVKNIRDLNPLSMDTLVYVATMHVNPRLEGFNRGFTIERWKMILQPFIEQVLCDPSYNPEGDTKRFLYKLAYPIMWNAVIHYYKQGSYPIDGIVEYETYRKKVQFADWFYYGF